MRTLYDLCKPRDGVFDEGRRDDVLDLTDLMDNSINPQEFFEVNFVTQGMNQLFDTAFKRFTRQSPRGVIKLTQAMGGGKTHNMIALGLLARHPEYRQQVMGERFEASYLGKVKVVAFTGRESDAPYGIWGAIADQLGKKEAFKEYYSPLQAPGQKAWENLLKGEPLLILLDELPPYLENAKSKTIGDTNLAVVTTTALANLFTAIGKEELSNVCLVISDLKATYQSGSELIQSTFKELDNEVNRSSLNIEPVGSASDEVYHILRKQLFKQLPDSDEINEVAGEFKKAVSDARQMDYTNESPEKIFVGIKDSYPFHPSMKDLYARFKENEGFQQTRGLIRLMRLVVRQLFQGKKQKKYLINVYDFDLNEQEMFSAITEIKSSLTNAIAHDISSGGKAVAEIVDQTMGETCMQELSKLILVASLADVPNALLGLSDKECIGYLAGPLKDITRYKRAMDDFLMRAWYLYTDKDGRIFFRNTKNLIAEMNTLVDSYDSANAIKELQDVLKETFKPRLGDCYQAVHVFPAIDEITISEDKNALVLFDPYTGSSSKHPGLHPDLAALYEDARYKNRIMFLSGQRSTREKLFQAAKEHKAINVIIKQMVEDGTPESNPQYIKADQKRDKTKLEVLQAARETFISLFYPGKNGLMKADFLMTFAGNDFNGEKQIRDVLMQRQKFTEDIADDTFRRKCEDRLFTQKEMRWVDVKERAATNPLWQWHKPDALDYLRDDMLRKGIWRENGGYIEKPPFPKEKTEIVWQELRRDTDTGEVTLKLIPKYGDQVFYEVGGPATSASMAVDNVNEYKTRELRVHFVCIDSTGIHETGDSKPFTNTITVKHRVYDKGEQKMVELRAAPDAKIKYTTDGSNPKEHGGIYDTDIAIPADTTYVLAVAEAVAESDVIYSDVERVKIDWTNTATISVDKQASVKLCKRYKTDDTAETYTELRLLKKHQAELQDVTVTLFKTDENNSQKGWVDLQVDASTKVQVDKLEESLSIIRDNLVGEGRVNVSLEFNTAIFKTGQGFLDWLADKRKTLHEFDPQEIIQ